MSGKNEQANRKAYAMSFASFLIRSLGVDSKINCIILYGSVAKGTSTKESDIDIFIDVEKHTEKFRRDISNIHNEFYKSREAIIFKLLGVENEIKLKIGELNEWGDLKRSILSDGFVLWGKFDGAKPNKTRHMVIFYWEGIEKNRGAFLNKIYGFKTKGKAYEGLISKSGGSRLGKSCIMIPIKYREKFTELTKKYRVDTRIIEVFM